MTRDDHQIPPSFTPQGGSSRRPGSASDAIAVGGAGRPERSGRVPRRDDAVPVEPRVRRQSSREIPVTPQRRSATPQRHEAGAGGQQPRSFPPGSGQARRAGGRPVAAASAPRPAPDRAAAARRLRTGTPAGAARRPAAAPGGGFRVRKRRVAGLTLALLLVLLLAWPVGLLVWANGKIQHVEALSGARGTPGTTYLLAGSDARGSGGVEDETEGARTDTIMLLHKPRSGPTALISLPRDTYVEIPGHGANKINAAYSFGGAPLLVETVEHLSGLTVDHYAEVGFGSVSEIVDAVDGVELCLDYDVNDPNSGLVWQAGCRTADGPTAVAFSRMRYADPKGDIGRAERQRQVIQAVAEKVADRDVLIQPQNQVQLVEAGTDALVVDERTGIIDLGRLAFAFRKATGPEGVTGTPPIANPGYDPGTGVGSTVLLDEDEIDQFWADLRDGAFEPGSTVGGL
ncbi:LCP family protein [Isoptericola variabilis]|uniref:Cell envelope-related transcriptional attenuator n=1 Tax=Isoptericola variabilis (strain 225) TaxID=743718 RepID=F6FS32_ISOV2|nr:LCP family protein [Isoptericola variabilis]AEG45129.1 cell envelope-related transcriptional attenuator [Isoptericola variabilis 225]